MPTFLTRDIDFHSDDPPLVDVGMIARFRKAVGQTEVQRPTAQRFKRLVKKVWGKLLSGKELRDE